MYFSREMNAEPLKRAIFFTFLNWDLTLHTTLLQPRMIDCAKPNADALLDLAHAWKGTRL